MIAKMIIDIRYENAKDHPTVQLFGVTFRSRTVLAEFVHNFRVAGTFAITELPHGHCRKEWQPEITFAVETPGNQNRFFIDIDEIVSRIRCGSAVLADDSPTSSAAASAALATRPSSPNVCNTDA